MCHTIGLGCMGFTRVTRLIRKKRRPLPPYARLLKPVSLFDTAEVFSMFKNEELVGEALEPFRNEVVIATKFGYDMANVHFEGSARPVELSSKPGKSSAVLSEGSLRRLRRAISICIINTVWIRIRPLKKLPIPLSSLIKEGKVLHWGIVRSFSCHSPSGRCCLSAYSSTERIFDVVQKT